MKRLIRTHSAMLHKLQRRRFDFPLGGLPKVFEDKNIQKDAAAYVEGFEYEKIERKAEDFRFIKPKDWVIEETHSNGTHGEVITSWNCRPERTRDQQGRQGMGRMMSTAFVIISFKPPPTYEQLLIKQPHRVVFRHWMDNCHKSLIAEEYSELDVTYGYPCTPYADDAGGSYAWSTGMFRKTIKMVQYWRFIVHPDYDRIFLISYQTTPDVLGDHLAQRWFGMNLIEKVETGPFIF